MVPGSYRLTVISLEGGEAESSTRLKVMTEMAMRDPVIAPFPLSHTPHVHCAQAF